MVKVTDHLNFRQLPINAHFQVYLLRHFRVELKNDGWYWQYGTWSTACQRPIFEFPYRKGITRVQTSRNVDISLHSNGDIFRYWVMLQSHGWVRWAGSPTYTVYGDVTFTRSKVKVKVTGLLNFRQQTKPCMLGAITAAPLRDFLVNVFRWQNWESLVGHELGVKCFEHVVTVNSWTFHIIHFSLILCLCIASPHKRCPQAWILLLLYVKIPDWPTHTLSFHFACFISWKFDHLLQNKIFDTIWNVILLGRCPSCCWMNSVEVLKEIQSMTLSWKNRPLTLHFVDSPTDSKEKGFRILSASCP